MAYPWEGTSPQRQELATSAGQCSLLQSDSDSFVKNFAYVGGGAIYASNITSLILMCSGATAASLITGCDDWAGNGVQQQIQGDQLGVQVCTP